ISTAIKTATDEVVAPFGGGNGHTMRASYAPSGALIPRFDRGEPVDLFLTDSAAIDELIKRGKVVAPRTDLARTGIGIAVRKGAPKPDVSSPEALKRTLLAARTVGHAAPAGGSITAAHIQSVFRRLGIAAEVTPKVKLAAGGPNGRVSVLVSSGEAEIGLQQVSELMSNPEVEVIGMLPAELQLITLYSAGVTTSASKAKARRALTDQGLDRAIRGRDLKGKGPRSRMVGDNVMRTRAIAAAAVLIVTASSAHAAEIDAMITTAMKAAVDELAPPFERANRHVLRITYGPSGGLARGLNAGEAADLVVVDSKALDELIKQGKVVGGRTDVARTGIGIAVRKGAPKPDVSSPEALRRALLAAKSIAHTAPAGGGVTAAHVMGVFARLGIAAEVAPKVKLAAGGPNGRVSVLVSSGEAEIGLQQVSELMSNPEVEVIGMLPGELQQMTTYSAG